VVSVERTDPFRHIRSAILKTSQPRAAKLTPHKSITATIAKPSSFYRMIATLSRDGK
jgi:hypothetical protein